MIFSEKMDKINDKDKNCDSLGMIKYFNFLGKIESMEYEIKEIILQMKTDNLI